MPMGEPPMASAEAATSIFERQWESAERQWLQTRRKCVLPGLPRAFPSGHEDRRGSARNGRVGDAEGRASDPQSEASMGIGDTAMDISKTPTAIAEPPMRFGGTQSPAAGGPPGAGDPRPPQREDHGDLHTRAESRRPRHPEPRRYPVTRRLMRRIDGKGIPSYHQLKRRYDELIDMLP
jgi:hypothetical protein